MRSSYLGIQGVCTSNNQIKNIDTYVFLISAPLSLNLILRDDSQFIVVFIFSTADYSFWTSGPNSTPRQLQFYFLLTLLLYFLFIFYLPRFTLPDFTSMSSQTSSPFLSCCHRTTTYVNSKTTSMFIHWIIFICLYIYIYI